ncbi:hypothetical protein [Halotalea alkalilenta]|uniref:hypothetical protein n=1 Tax=Halotalea alkalilenta TaxID=376489 RepID=UPI000486F22C|nr:hypothetical protein [Halotalea alkalilenta]
MEGFVFALISFFIIGPLQQTVENNIEEMGLTQQSARQVVQCLSEDYQEIYQRAASDIWRTATIAFTLWTGMVDANDALESIAPSCTFVPDDKAVES